MGLWKLFKLSLRAIKTNRRFSLLLLGNIFLGLFSLQVLFEFRNTVEISLSNNSKSILGSDLKVSSRRNIIGEDRKKIDDAIAPGMSQRSDMMTSYSMVNFSQAARLVYIKAIQTSFPFYGKMLFQDGTSDWNINNFGMAVSLDLANQYELKKGDRVRLGSQDFTVRHIIEKDVGVSTNFANLAPSVYISLEDFKPTGL
ncbi:MAG: hypothetical protein AB8E15_14055, partial [Bdellovibrionales bacterium]